METDQGVIMYQQQRYLVLEYEMDDQQKKIEMGRRARMCKLAQDSELLAVKSGMHGLSS